MRSAPDRCRLRAGLVAKRANRLRLATRRPSPELTDPNQEAVLDLHPIRVDSTPLLRDYNGQMRQRGGRDGQWNRKEESTDVAQLDENGARGQVGG